MAGAAHEQASDGRTQVTTLRRRPTAFASVYEPDGRRTRWLLTFRCDHCGGTGHHGFAKTLDDIAPDHGEGRRSGVRRAACGRRVWLVVARIYPAGQVAIPAQRRSA